MDPNIAFSSPALGPTSKPGLSSARLLRRKKPTPAPHSRPTPLINDPGFNPFVSVPGSVRVGQGDASGFGAREKSSDSNTNLSSLNLDNYIEKNAVADEIRKLKIENESSVNLREKSRKLEESGFGFELWDEMRHLNIGNEGNVRGFGAELPDAMKKMNIEDHGNVEARSFSERPLHNEMNNLNFKEPVASCAGARENEKAGVSLSEKSSFAFGICGKGDEILKGSGENEMSLHSSGEKLNEVRADSLGGAERHGVSELSFQVGMQGERLGGTEVHLEDQSTTTSSLPFPSSGVHFQGFGNAFEAQMRDRVEKKVHFSFTSKSDDMGMRNVEFKTPHVKGGLNRKMEMKRESAKGIRSKKTKGKAKKSNPVQVNSRQDFDFNYNLQEIDDSSEPYSPMDISPYQERMADDGLSRETSVASDETFDHDDNSASIESCPVASSDARDEDLADATERVINEGEKHEEIKEEEAAYCSDKGANAEGRSEESISGAETESFKSATDHLEYSTDSFITAADTLASTSDTEVTSSSMSGKLDKDRGNHFDFASSLEGKGESGFIFAASSAAQSQSSPTLRQYKKKNRTKVGYDSCSSTPSTKDSYAPTRLEFKPVSGTSTLRKGIKGDVSTWLNQRNDTSEPVKKQEIKQEAISSSAASIAVQEACEKWRLRGNQAYSKGELSKAEDYYTEGVNSVSESESSRSCLRALMLCYSNRAATRMSLGRIKEALEDCMKAAALDPNFLKVQVRAANCYLALGEIENASLHFMKCLQAGTDICVDRKLLVEASEGIEKAQKVSKLIKQSAELLERRNVVDTECALGLIDETLIISPYCEQLLEAKADALLMLQKYDDVIQLCRQNLGTSMSKFDGSDTERRFLSIPWCWSLILRAYFYTGRLEEAFDFLKKQHELQPATEKNLESLIPIAGTISELVRRKTAGNEAFQSGRHAEAVQHYSAAISCNVESRPFAAICFCNRAAAYQAMGQIVDAIADCSLAIALDRNYLKAFSRRAALFEMIRDYAQASLDLQRLVSLLTKKLEGMSADRMNYTNELRQNQLKLSQMEEAARKEIPLDMYLILGVDQSAPASEIKKAYRKAALKHHPDKAGQSLVRSENGDDGLWKEIAAEVHKDADRLFKMIGEAYAVLSDPSRRSQYDLEEEMRNVQNRGSGRSTSRMHADFQSYPYERSSGRWQEGRRQYGSSQPKGSERSRSNW